MNQAVAANLARFYGRGAQGDYYILALHGGFIRLMHHAYGSQGWQRKVYRPKRHD